MFVNNRKIKFMILTVNLALTVVIGLTLNLLILKDARAGSDMRKFSRNCKVLIADRVFDGFNLHENTAVLFKNNQIVEVGANDYAKKTPLNALIFILITFLSNRSTTK